jgi:hypothetical protein
VLLDILAKFFGFLFAVLGEGMIVTPVGQFGEVFQHIVEKEGQPNAFPFSFDSYPIHSVIPITGAYQWQAMDSKTQTVLNGTDTVLVKAGFV